MKHRNLLIVVFIAIPTILAVLMIGCGATSPSQRSAATAGDGSQIQQHTEQRTNYSYLLDEARAKLRGKEIGVLVIFLGAVALAGVGLFGLAYTSAPPSRGASLALMRLLSLCALFAPFAFVIVIGAWLALA